MPECADRSDEQNCNGKGAGTGLPAVFSMCVFVFPPIPLSVSLLLVSSSDIRVVCLVRCFIRLVLSISRQNSVIVSV